MNQRFVLAVLFLSISIALAQEPKKDDLSQKPQWQRLLHGDDSKKASELEKRRNEAEAKDDYETATQASKALCELRRRIQGEDHYQAADERWISNALVTISKLPAPDRAEWRASRERAFQAQVLEQTGRSREALSAQQFRLGMCQKVLGDEHPATALSFFNVAANLKNQGRYAEAELLYKRALAIYEKVLGVEHPSTAAVFSNMAGNLSAQGKYAEAELLYKNALAIWVKTRGDEHPYTAAGFSGVAGNLSTQGKYAEAEPLFKKALAICRKTLGEEHPNTAASWNNLAFNLNAQDRCAEAEPFFETALAIWQRTFGDEHHYTAQCCHNMATNLSEQGKHAAAEPLFQKALTIRLKLLGEEHPDTALSYEGVASNLDHRGKYAEAEQLHRKALDILQKTVGDEHPSMATCCISAAGTLGSQGKYAEAEPLFKKALAIRKKTLGDEHRSTAAAFHSVAAILNSLGRFDESRQFLNRCRVTFEAGRFAAAARGADRASLSGDGNPYPLLAATQARLKSPREAFAALEIGLARGLLDELGARASAGLTDQEATTHQDRAKRLAVIEPRIATLVARQKRTQPEQKELDELLVERTELGQQLSKIGIAVSQRRVAPLEEIQKSLEADEAWVAWVDVTMPGVSEHWGCVLRSIGDPAFIPLPGIGENAKFTGQDDELPDKVRAFFRKREVGPQAEINALAKALHRQRLAPLEKHLQGASRLYVVAIHRMAAIPVEALTDRYSVGYVPSATFLARNKVAPPPQTSRVLALGDPIYEVEKATPPGSLPPGGLLVLQVIPGGIAENAGRIRAGDVLLSYAGIELKTPDDLVKAIANHANDKSAPIVIWREGLARSMTRDVPPGKLGVVLAKQPAPTALAKRREFDKLNAALDRGGEWKELPGTRLELETLKELFNEKATILVDEDASESSVDALRQKGSLGKFRYLHFASHGAADNFRAYESALILSQNDPKRQQFAPTGTPWINGKLTAREVLEYWKLDAELVTLSACQTALGRSGGGDGLLGFAQAFLLAGSRSVCLSLWEVDDRATALLMDRFYRNLVGKREGLDKPMRKADALAEAKRWLRNLTQDEAAERLAQLSDGVTRGKGERLKLAAPQVDPKADPKQVRPFDHPRFWAAFILIGDPS